MRSRIHQGSYSPQSVPRHTFGQKFEHLLSNHLRADFDTVEDLAVVDSNDGADQLRNDNHVSEVSSAFSGLK